MGRSNAGEQDPRVPEYKKRSVLIILFTIRQQWLRRHGPGIIAGLSKLLHQGRNVSFGEGLRCDGIPRLLVDKDAELIIGSDVELCSGVEIRVHKSAQVVIEDGVRIDRGVRILATNGSVVRIGAGSRIGLYSVLNGGDSIHVGERCLISGFVYLQTSMHRSGRSDLDIQDQGYDHAEVRIGRGAWIGAHAIVMPGCSVGSGAVIGSNAVVTRGVPAGAVAVGVPARIIRQKEQQ